MKIFIPILTFLASTAFADNTTNPIVASSTLSATCSISANSISFGNLLLPLSAQSSSGAIQLLCSKQAPYTIDLAYGGVYGQGNSSDGSYWTLVSNPATSGYSVYDKFYSNGKPTNDRITWFGYVSTSVVSSTFNCTFSGSLCVTGKPSYDYGIMKGASKGDSIAYSIFIPGDTSKVWNAGKNSYSGSGTGQQEQISFQAKIVPAQSGAPYPAPDFYADTVIATVKY